jgi:hypothetical protein
MSCELNKHILPHLENTPLEEISHPLMRGLIQTWQREGLSRKSIKNLFGVVRAIYNFQFDEIAQSGRPIVFAVARQNGKRSHLPKACNGNFRTSPLHKWPLLCREDAAESRVVRTGGLAQGHGPESFLR